MDVPTRVAPNAGGTRVLLDGRGLTLPDLVRLADAAAVPAVDPGALDRVRRARETADRLAATGRWYGRGTGVGAHRSVTVDPADETAHGLRLLRSHAGGAGSAAARPDGPRDARGPRQPAPRRRFRHPPVLRHRPSPKPSASACTRRSTSTAAWAPATSRPWRRRP